MMESGNVHFLISCPGDSGAVVQESKYTFRDTVLDTHIDTKTHRHTETHTMETTLGIFS